MYKPLIKLFSGLGFALLLLPSFTDTAETDNQLSAEEKKEGWKLLFDGKTTNGWHLYNRGKVPSAWIVQHGELYCKPEFGTIEHGDLVSDKEFKNFDLTFDWKISEAGNSGVFFNVLERKDLPTAWASGPEYQLLEKTHPDYAMNEKKRAGSLFGFTAPKNHVDARSVNEWNQGRIKQVNGKIEFYLNGVLTIEEDLTSKAWKDAVAKSNFKTFPEFGKHLQGHIALQDWSKGIAFKNIKIKEL